MRSLTAISLAGLIVALVAGLGMKSVTGDLIALIVGGVSATSCVCLAFYAVGRSEDREREQRMRDQELRARDR